MQRTVYGEVGKGRETDARTSRHRRYTDFTRTFKTLPPGFPGLMPRAERAVDAPQTKKRRKTRGAS
ncbi:hypothetical protein ASG35_23885 [Burkholderia sp. Leaf177]|nr:hypothetical protein ASG35_23885 [Burkholderia sp. Leaf177]